MLEKLQKLTDIAKRKMKNSYDPVHDLGHVERVAKYAERLGKDHNLEDNQIEALILASYWHDVSRTITKKPSIILMPLVDDMLSAIMLWLYSLRFGLIGNVAGMASRTILCKSLGTGALFTRIFMRRKNRIMIDILKDADMLDVLNQERIKKLMTLAEKSRLYKLGYKTAVSWFLKNSHLHMRTKAARIYVEQIMINFWEWLKEKTVYKWHIDKFGEKWVKKMLILAELLITHIRKLNSLSITESRP